MMWQWIPLDTMLALFVAIASASTVVYVMLGSKEKKEKYRWK